MIRRGKYGMFVAGSGYPDCKTTVSLPAGANLKASDKVCEICGFPMVKQFKKKSFQEFCLNPKCKSKEFIPEKDDSGIIPYRFMTLVTS